MITHIDIRDDIGALWENFCVIERLKHLQAEGRRVRSYYWRNNDQREIDIIEEEGDALRAYECKAGAKINAKIPLAFTKLYPSYTFDIVNPNNYPDVLLKV